MIAVCAAKFVGYVCKKMGRQGVTWAGKVAIKICPDILEQLSSQVRKAIFATCGTNGKTTTNNMLCAALEAEGQKVICNHTGSNMLNGVVATLASSASVRSSTSNCLMAAFTRRMVDKVALSLARMAVFMSSVSRALRVMVCSLEGLEGMPANRWWCLAEYKAAFVWD